MSPQTARTLAILDKFDSVFGCNNPNNLGTWKHCPWQPPKKALAVYDQKARKWVVIRP